MDAAGREVGDDREEFLEGAPEPVEPGDAEAIAKPCVVEELGEPGAVEVLAGDDIGEHAHRAGGDQALALGVETLVCGRDASVAEGIAMAGGLGPIPRLVIDRFRDGSRRQPDAPKRGQKPSLYSSIYCRQSLNRNQCFGDAPWPPAVLSRHRKAAMHRWYRQFYPGKPVPNLPGGSDSGS